MPPTHIVSLSLSPKERQALEVLRRKQEEFLVEQGMGVKLSAADYLIGLLRARAHKEGVVIDELNDYETSSQLSRGTYVDSEEGKARLVTFDGLYDQALARYGSQKALSDKIEVPRNLLTSIHRRSGDKQPSLSKERLDGILRKLQAALDEPASEPNLLSIPTKATSIMSDLLPKMPEPMKSQWTTMLQKIVDGLRESPSGMAPPASLDAGDEANRVLLLLAKDMAAGNLPCRHYVVLVIDPDQNEQGQSDMGEGSWLPDGHLQSLYQMRLEQMGAKRDPRMLLGTFAEVFEAQPPEERVKLMAMLLDRLDPNRQSQMGVVRKPASEVLSTEAHTALQQQVEAAAAAAGPLGADTVQRLVEDGLSEGTAVHLVAQTKKAAEAAMKEYVKPVPYPGDDGEPLGQRLFPADVPFSSTKE